MMPRKREHHFSVLKRRRFQSISADGDFGEMKKTETPAKSRRVGRYARPFCTLSRYKHLQVDQGSSVLLAKCSFGMIPLPRHSVDRSPRAFHSSTHNVVRASCFEVLKLNIIGNIQRYQLQFLKLYHLKLGRFKSIS